jgi:hypothetical protein
MPTEGKSFPFISRKAVPATTLVLEEIKEAVDHHRSSFWHLGSYGKIFRGESAPKLSPFLVKKAQPVLKLMPQPITSPAE